MEINRLGQFLSLQKIITMLMIVCFALPAHSSSFVLGKQYLLKPKRQLSSLVWYAVTFDKSITGGLKVSLKVFSEKGKSLEFLDDFRDFVAPEIAERCVSKFSMTNYRMDFNEQKRSELAFQTNSISDVMYIPLKVKYEDGFEDYLVRVRIKGGKFAISTRPLQHGMLKTPDENAIENYRAEQLKQKEDLKKKEAAKQAKIEADKKKEEERLKAKQAEIIENAPAVNINDELFDTDSANLDELLKESETKALEKETEAKKKIKPIDEADLYSQPLQTPPEVVAPVSDERAPTEATDASQNEDQGQTDDSGLDALFQDGGAALTPTNEPAPTNQNLNPFDVESDNGEFSNKDENSKPTERVPTNAIDDDDEIEIEGFDEALEEIERLENLEKK